MPVRLIDILDFLKINKYRQDLVPLDTARFLTHGKLLNIYTLFPALDSGREIATAIHKENGDSVLGQVALKAGSSVANLSFISPENVPPHLQLEMIEFLIAQSGNLGAFSLQAEVEEDSPLFTVLRQAGFSMYAWQRVWKLNRVGSSRAESVWVKPRDDELIEIQNLHSQIVPTMLQAIEEFPVTAHGLICKQGDNLQAHLSLLYGPNGIWVQPLIHPDAVCLPDWTGSITTSIPIIRRRPVYFCVRSYQAWLESMLEDQGATAGNRQAVMVRHLTVSKILNAQSIKNNNSKPAWAKPATPISQYKPVNGDTGRNE